MFEQAPAWLQDLLRVYFPSGELEHSAQVSKCESGWNPNAWKNDAVEDSRGLFQINVRAHPDALALNLFDPAVNVAYAARMAQEQGWRPWSCATLLGIVWGGGGSPPPPSPGSPAVVNSKGGVIVLIAAVIILSIIMR